MNRRRTVSDLDTRDRLTRAASDVLRHGGDRAALVAAARRYGLNVHEFICVKKRVAS